MIRDLEMNTLLISLLSMGYKKKIGSVITGTFIDYMDNESKLLYLNKWVLQLDNAIYNTKIDIRKNKRHGNNISNFITTCKI